MTLPLGPGVGVRVMTRGALEPGHAFVEASAKNQALAWKAYRLQGGFDVSYGVQIVVLRRRPMAGSAHLYLGERF